jgi:type II restriction enzyme
MLLESDVFALTKWINIYICIRKQFGIWKMTAIMKTTFNLKLAENYKSQSQRIRVITENWVGSEIYCPSCGRNINQYKSNKPVADFYCTTCNEDYELKSKKFPIGAKILNGAFGTMIKRLNSIRNPNFFILNYDPEDYAILNFLVIPKHFFVPAIIEKRRPLSPKAKRANYVGCNILLKQIPSTGKIFYIKDKKIEPKDKVLENWDKTLFLRESKETKARGWILDIMGCIDKLEKNTFSLDEVYRFEDTLKDKYPDNRHIKDKIRQQLQLLRDKGYLEFTNRGQYKLKL